VLRRILFAGLALAPATIVLHWFASIGSTAEFALAAAALVPLAWLIGEATEHAADHTGPGIGGFLNATFGNAPELIIALLAVDRGLTEVVRGSLTGSVIGNLLLVLGFSLAAGGDGALDRASTLVSLGLIGIATLLFLVPAIPGWDGDPNRHSLAVTSAPVAILLLLVYIATTWKALQRHAEMHAGSDDSLTGWSLRNSIAALAVATVATALVAEVLVGSLEDFAHKVGLTDFFVAAVIVAIVGNAAEHGGAVIVAYRGKLDLAAEIATSSAAQVAVFLIPAVAILSWLIEPLALTFRPIELAALGGSLAVTVVLLASGRSTRWRGILLVAAYVGVAIAFYSAGDRFS
jgi:Ca2+:H+ antiporter